LDVPALKHEITIKFENLTLKLKIPKLKLEILTLKLEKPGLIWKF
jgi:hypothetical protein